MSAPAHIARENGKKGGRPKGTTTRPIIRDFLSDEKVSELVAIAVARAEEGDSNLMKFLLEQVFGKAVQPIGNDGGKPLIIQFDGAFTSSPKEDSAE